MLSKEVSGKETKKKKKEKIVESEHLLGGSQIVEQCWAEHSDDVVS